MKIKSVRTQVYRIPTDKPEADGTFAWNSTTMVVVELLTDSPLIGLGFSYTSRAAETVIQDLYSGHLENSDPLKNGASWSRMLIESRNAGLPGVCATAVSAVDIALWDLKAKLLGTSVAKLLPIVRTQTPVYGSGGFTSYSDQDLTEQLEGWLQQGITRFKIKIGKDFGTRTDWDIHWVRLARQVIGEKGRLFVDANGAYSAKQAIDQARRFAEFGVSYFEEPVSSDHLKEMRLVREHVPMDVAAGEYGYTPWYFRDMLQAGAADILQADVTRCLGITGWLEAAHLVHGHGIGFSAHTSPAVHAQIACAAPRIDHIEYFHDHARIEEIFFDGAPKVVQGKIEPNTEKPGLGLELKRQDAEKWRWRG